MPGYYSCCSFRFSCCSDFTVLWAKPPHWCAGNMLLWPYWYSLEEWEFSCDMADYTRWSCHLHQASLDVVILNYLIIPQIKIWSSLHSLKGAEKTWVLWVPFRASEIEVGGAIPVIPFYFWIAPVAYCSITAYCTNTAGDLSRQTRGRAETRKGVRRPMQWFKMFSWIGMRKQCLL